MIRRIVAAAAVLLAAAHVAAAPSLSRLRSGAGDAPAFTKSGGGYGLYLDSTPGTGLGDLYYLDGGTDWLKLSCGSSTCTFSSTAGTTFDFDEILDVNSIVNDGTLTQTGDATFAGGSGALTILGAMERGPWFEATFDEGASKGIALTSGAGAAYVTTADAGNLVHYGASFRGSFITNTTATGTITPAATATGVDLNAGSPGNSDEWTLTMGQGGAVGGMIIPGTTPAWKACATVNMTTVTEVAGLWLLVASAGTHVDLSSADPNYTSYVGIGVEQTDIVVSDSTTGPTDTTDNAANGVSETWCILGSAAGVITYTRNGAAPTVTDAHTLADGVAHVVRIQGLNHTGTEAPMNLVSLSLLPQ